MIGTLNPKPGTPKQTEAVRDHRQVQEDGPTCLERPQETQRRLDEVPGASRDDAERLLPGVHENHRLPSPPDRTPPTIS